MTFAPPALAKRDLYAILGALMLGMLLAALDGTIVSTALPTIVGELHGANHLSWVVVAYLLASTVTTPLWGKLGDLYGRKRLFQLAIVIFLVGSLLCGLAQSMNQLIAFRALQGLGGGGLLVGAQAIIGDIVGPRERGRYSGFFGAVFGFATVVGPLVGGLLVDHTSWRWVFLVNLPVGLIALVVTAIELPSSSARVSHVIDYVGVLLLTVGSSAIILFTSLGGSSIAWSSPWSVGFVVTGVVLLSVFVLVERRAVEPILSMHLMKNRVVASASSIGFVTGFAMYGAMTFLPLYFQVVRGSSATVSGLKLLPLMGGLFATSITAGQLLARGWRYRRFPIVGTMVTTIGLALLSLVTAKTTSIALALFMVVLGAGLGLTMQVLVTAAQNAVAIRDLGAATGATNFFRSMGGSVGTAVFGALFNNILPGKEHTALAPVVAQYPGQVPVFKNLTPALFAKLPPAIAEAIKGAYASAISSVYHWAVPVGALAVLLAFTLPEVQLRSHLDPDTPEAPVPNGEE